MNRYAIGAAIAAILTGAAYAQAPTTQTPATRAPATTGVGRPTQTEVMNEILQASTSISGFYQHNVYDAANLDAKIGQIKDVLLDKDGKIGAFIIGVGDFIGVDRKDRNTTLASPFVDEKNVAVPFNSIRVVYKDGMRWLTMNASRDALRSAPGYKYDKNTANWLPA